jgi:ferrous iron transport protein A
MVLSELENGKQFTVHRIRLTGEVGKRLADMGFTRGVKGYTVRCALPGDPIQVRLLNYCVSIRKAEAAGIEIEPGDPAAVPAECDKRDCCDKVRHGR